MESLTVLLAGVSSWARGTVTHAVNFFRFGSKRRYSKEYPKEFVPDKYTRGTGLKILLLFSTAFLTISTFVPSQIVRAEMRTIDKRFIPIFVGNIPTFVPIESYRIEGELRIDDSDPYRFALITPAFTHIANEQVAATYTWKVKIPHSEGASWQVISDGLSGEISPHIYYEYYGYELTVEMVLTSLDSLDQAIIRVSDNNHYSIPMFSAQNVADQASGSTSGGGTLGLVPPPWQVNIRYHVEEYQECYTACQGGHWNTIWNGRTYCTGKVVWSCRQRNEFSNDEMARIQEAVDTLAQRLLHPDAKSCALRDMNQNATLINVINGSSCFTNCQHGSWKTIAGFTYCDGTEVYNCTTGHLPKDQFDTFVNSVIESYYDYDLDNPNKVPKIHFRRGAPEACVTHNGLTTEAYAETGKVNDDYTSFWPPSINDPFGHPGEFFVYLCPVTIDGSPTSEHLAGVIAHEIMHQMGHIHPRDPITGDDLRTDFAYTFQNCIEDSTKYPITLY